MRVTIQSATQIVFLSIVRPDSISSNGVLEMGILDGIIELQVNWNDSSGGGGGIEASLIQFF